MRVSPSMHYSGHDHKVAEEDGDHEHLERVKGSGFCRYIYRKMEATA